MTKAEIRRIIKRLNNAAVCCHECGDKWGVYSVGCSSTWNGYYSPENCKWSSDAEQAANRRTCRILPYQGKLQCLSAWSRELNITRHMISKGLDQGMTLEEIVQQHKTIEPNAA